MNAVLSGFRTENRGGRIQVFCGCCGQEKVGEYRDGKFCIMQRRHGKQHMAEIPIDNISALAILGLVSQKTEPQAEPQSPAP